MDRNIVAAWLGKGPVIKVTKDSPAHFGAAQRAELNGGLEFVKEAGNTHYYKVHPDLLFYLNGINRIE